MNNHSVKFIFVIVVVTVVLFSRMAYQASAPAALSQTQGANILDQSQRVPLIALSPIAASVGGGEGAHGLDPPDATSTQAAAGGPATGAVASLLADIKTGAVFEASGANKRWPIASIAKLMTATIALNKLDPATKITITEPMFATDPEEPTLVVSGTYTVADLLRAMLLPSSNVAAEALATFYGRGRFIDEMNARALAWGMADTYFGDPSGVSATDQSTANDLLKLAEKISIDYPSVLQITRAAQATITEGNSGKKIVVKSINDFAGEPDFMGGKTGHTEEASGNLLSIFRYGGRTIGIIVLGTDDRFGNTRKLYAWFKTNFK